jgi:ABC-type multidrug transport system permease subunit
LKAQTIKNFVVGLVIGIVFYGQGVASSPLYSNGVPNAEVSNVSSILFFTMMYTMVGNLQAIPYLSSQILVYRRELASNAYFPEPFWLSQLITTIPIQFAYHFLFIIWMYFLVGLPSDADYFFYFLFLLFFANTCAYYSAMWLAAATNNEQLAFAIFPILFLFLAQFAGFSISIDDVPSFWSWAPYISYARWVFEGLMVNEWNRFDTDDVTDDAAMDGNGDVLSMYDFTGFDKNDSFWITLLYVLGFAFLTYIALLPPKKRLEQVETGKMTASAAKSFFDRDSKLPKKKSTSLWGGSDKTQLLRETLLADSHEPDEDDIIEPQVPYTVEFYKISSGMIDQADGCNVVFKDICYTVTDKLDASKKTKLLTNVSGQVRPGETSWFFDLAKLIFSISIFCVADRRNVCFNGCEWSW